VLSGKSTLLAIFLRLLDPTTGTIRIDGYDIGIVPRNTLRNRVLCLPQDPLLFPGTFRFNLDPEDHTKSVTEMGSVLKKLKLWDLIQKLGGLDAYMTPESLSHGEQQLLVLSRAILKKRTSSVQRSILILDEATSNLDASSELAIHEAIQEEFKNDTVISVAHRLDTLKDMDMVLLLENGKIAKIGQPAEVIPSSSQC
jgi:ABC-type multidrug transport system fused ATPase/permease subunit